LLPNNPASETFSTNLEQCKWLTGYLLLECRPGGDWVNSWH